MKKSIRIVGLFLSVSLIVVTLLVKLYPDRRDYVKPEQPVGKKATYTELQPKYQVGKVSYYDRTYCEKHSPMCRTASGEVFDDRVFTCACSRDYSLGTFLKISYQDRSVIVRCNDRGNFEKYGRIADLSKTAFEALANTEKGVIKVKIEEL